MVGTSAVSLASVDNMRNCKDSTGAVDRAARHPVRDDRARAAVLRPVVPDRAAAGRLRDEGPSTRRRSTPTCRAAATTTRSTARGSSTASTSSAATRSRPVTRRSRASAPCATSGSSPTRTSTCPASRTQSAYTPVVQEMKNQGSNYGQAITASAMVLHAQGGRAAGPHRREGVGLRRGLLRQAVPQQRRLRRRGPVRRHAVPALLTRRTRRRTR